MRKTFKTIVALLLCVVMASGAGIAPVCAAENVSEVVAETVNGSARAGNTVNHYVAGGSGSFNMTASNSISNWSVSTSGFNSNTILVVTVYNSSGRCISATSPMLRGNQSAPNAGLLGTYPSGIYTIKYVMSNTNSNGWLKVNLF